MKNHYTYFNNLIATLICSSFFLSNPVHSVTLSQNETVLLFGTTTALSQEISGTILEEQVSNFSVEINGQIVTGSVCK